MNGQVAFAVPRSDNAKIGDAATTYAAQASCPSECVFFDGGGCYAETGMVGKFVTAPLNESARAAEATAVDVAFAEAGAIDGLTAAGRPLRLHTVGDCASDECAQIVAAASERYMERGGGAVWTYTHAWRVVSRESWGRVSVLASCETPVDVALARERGYATALVVEQHPGETLYDFAEQPASSSGASLRERVKGERPGSEDAPVTSVLPCPAQTRDVPCSDCGLCFDDAGIRERGYSIGFELHGIPYAVRQARRALREPENPRRKMLAEDELRELLARRPDLSAAQAGAELDMNPGYAAQLLAYLRGEAKHPSVLRRERYERKKLAA